MVNVSATRMEKVESQLKSSAPSILLNMDSLPLTPPRTVVEDETIPPPQPRPAAKGQSSTPDTLYTAQKGELPNFSGDNPDSWLLSAERYFQINSVLDKDCMESIALYLEGNGP